MPRKAHRPTTLSDRAIAFVREYAITCDLELAEAAAGYAPGHGNGNRIIRDPRAQKLLREHQKKADELAQVHLAWTLARFKQLADANAFDLLAIDADTGSFRIDLSKLTREQAYAVAELGFDAEGRPKIKFHDKVQALKVLKDHLTPDRPSRLRLEGPDGGPVEAILGLGDRLNAARARVNAQRALPPPDSEAA